MAASSPFQWNDALLLNQQITDDERAVRDAAHSYCQEKLAPRADWLGESAGFESKRKR
jgi:glutaryl-CoA dehydrogenase